MSWPAIEIRPESGASKPAIRRRVVVLPQPLGPSREMISAWPTSKPTSSTATTSPKRLLTALTSTIFIVSPQDR